MYIGVSMYSCKVDEARPKKWNFRTACSEKVIYSKCNLFKFRIFPLGDSHCGTC